MSGAEPRHPILRVFLHEMRALGYAEGRNLVVERRTAEGHGERFREIFTGLAGLDTRVIVTVGASTEVKRACDAVPDVAIVLFASEDPVKYGLAQSLAHPGRNVTGLTYYAGDEFEAKRFQLLREIVPKLARASYLVPKRALDEKTPIATSAARAARTLGIELLYATYDDVDFAPAFAAIERQRAPTYCSPLPTPPSTLTARRSWPSRGRCGYPTATPIPRCRRRAA